jgi:hypothetical protein
MAGMETNEQLRAWSEHKVRELIARLVSMWRAGRVL